ncbi:hypothetical protein J6590_058346 [Homalodisca vitripennis]|nr:hypothetical protein J6590_058346 [Homalodisca vitripennis]
MFWCFFVDGFATAKVPMREGVPPVGHLSTVRHLVARVESPQGEEVGAGRPGHVDGAARRGGGGIVVICGVAKPCRPCPHRSRLRLSTSTRSGAILDENK